MLGAWCVGDGVDRSQGIAEVSVLFVFLLAWSLTVYTHFHPGGIDFFTY